MKTPLLSICIPTYNRSRYLKWLLTHFIEHKQLLSDIEIVISDNCSDDDTETVATVYRDCLPLIYSRNQKNIGHKNLVAAYKLASGEYVAYLADDDLIDFRALRQSLDTLRSRSSASALFAPWRALNLKSKTVGPAFYCQSNSYEIPRGAYFAALDVLCHHHIFPEIGIIRREVAVQFLAAHDFAYCFFIWLSQCLQYGNVLFDRNPYYYSISDHICDDGRRDQAGISQAMTAWDAYRGGYEMLLACGLTREEKKDEKLIRTLRNKIDENVLIRMQVAYRLNLFRGHFKAAYLLYMRLRANGVCVPSLIGYDDLCLLAGMDDDGDLINGKPVGLPHDVFSRLRRLTEVCFPGKFYSLEGVPPVRNPEFSTVACLEGVRGTNALAG